VSVNVHFHKIDLGDSGSLAIVCQTQAKKLVTLVRSESEHRRRSAVRWKECDRRSMRSAALGTGLRLPDQTPGVN
jgi:hypothetical protein